MKPAHGRSESEAWQNRAPRLRLVEERRIGGRCGLVRVIDPAPGSPSLLVKKEVSKAEATRELQAYKAIGSLPSVVAIVDTREDTNGEVAMFFRYCAYGNVEQQVARRDALSLSEREKENIAQDFICALTEVHKCGYTHGPITPKHLLITAKKEAKLSNFSHSCALSALPCPQPSAPPHPCSHFRLGRYRESHTSRGAFERSRELQQLAVALVQFLLCDFSVAVTEETVGALPQCYAALKPALSVMAAADSLVGLKEETEFNGKLAVKVIGEVLR